MSINKIFLEDRNLWVLDDDYFLNLIPLDDALNGEKYDANNNKGTEVQSIVAEKCKLFNQVASCGIIQEKSVEQGDQDTSGRMLSSMQICYLGMENGNILIIDLDSQVQIDELYGENFGIST